MYVHIQVTRTHSTCTSVPLHARNTHIHVRGRAHTRTPHATRIFIFMCALAWVRTYMHATLTYTCTRTHAPACTYTHAARTSHAPVRMYCVLVHARHTHVQTYRCTCEEVYTHARVDAPLQARNMYIHIHVRACVCTYAHATRTLLYVRTHVLTHPYTPATHFRRACLCTPTHAHMRMCIRLLRVCSGASVRAYVRIRVCEWRARTYTHTHTHTHTSAYINLYFRVGHFRFRGGEREGVCVWRGKGSSQTLKNRKCNWKLILKDPLSRYTTGAPKLGDRERLTQPRTESSVHRKQKMMMRKFNMEANRARHLRCFHNKKCASIV